MTASIPLGTFTCVTGVSGSGKSTLIIETLYKALAKRLNGAREHPGAHTGLEGVGHLDKIVDIDQSPIGRTPRSNPATYTGAFSPIRDWFSQLPESTERGYKPGRFSFNVKGGRCEACQGDGVIKIEMHFLPDVYVQCDVCKGKRYNRETLEIHFRGKSIADVLEMTVDEGVEFFKAVPVIRDKLLTLQQVGLGYIHIGQQATTLSGGEAQRVKLAKELSRRATGRTLYILDEPTTGLHFEDVRKLLEVLHRLVEGGNTVVVIEHNLEVIKTADWVLDLGPDGGAGGGRMVAEGPPEEIVKVAESYTGQYLARHAAAQRGGEKAGLTAAEGAATSVTAVTGVALPPRASHPQTSSRPVAAHISTVTRVQAFTMGGVAQARRGGWRPVQADIAVMRRRLFSIGLPSPHTRGRQPVGSVAPRVGDDGVVAIEARRAPISRSINIRSPGAHPVTRNSTGRATGARLEKPTGLVEVRTGLEGARRSTMLGRRTAAGAKGF